MKKNLFVFFCLTVILIGALSFGRNQHFSRASSEQPAIDNARSINQTQQPSNIPDIVVYRQFFRHYRALKEKANEFERAGKTGEGLRKYYKDSIRLNNDQDKILDRIAAACERDVARIDAEAKKIIDEARARFPEGKVPPGQQLPPPKELRELQTERDKSILKARDELKKSLGDEQFQRVKDYIKINVAPNIRPAAVAPPQSQNVPAQSLIHNQ